MMPLTREEARALLPAYAVGALDADEHHALESALREFPDLQQELRSFTDVAAALASTESIAPSPALRTRFLDAVQNDVRKNEVDGAHHANMLNVERGAATNALKLERGGVSGSPRRNNMFASRVIPTLLAVALAASVVLLLRTRSDLASLQASVQRNAQLVAERDARIKDQDAVLSTLLDAEQALLVVNMDTPKANGPGMQFFWNVKEGRGMLHAYRLAAAPSGRTYQLWLIKDGKPVPSKLFNAGGNGRSIVTGIELPTSTEGVSAVAITEEPAGGSPAPTTQPFLVGAIRKTE